LADTDCSGKCCSDADCASVDCAPRGYPNRIAKCDLATYTCRCDPCSTNSDCKTDYCCDKDPAIPLTDRGTGNCNWGPTDASRIYKNKYLCDPPSWNENSRKENSNNFIDLLVSFLKKFG